MITCTLSLHHQCKVTSMSCLSIHVHVAWNLNVKIDSIKIFIVCKLPICTYSAGELWNFSTLYPTPSYYWTRRAYSLQIEPLTNIHVHIVIHSQRILWYSNTVIYHTMVGNYAFRLLIVHTCFTYLYALNHGLNCLYIIAI